MFPERYTSDPRALLAKAGLLLVARRARILRAVVLVALGTWILMPLDALLGRLLAVQDAEGLDRLARFATRWGDYLTLAVPAAVIVWMLGYAAHRRSLRLAAWACLLAASTAGLCANALKLAAGRPRPWSAAPDGFYGIRFVDEYQSFPSGHAASAFGVAAALGATLPAVRVPAMVVATTVGWSRIHLRQHHLSDVFLGGAMGLGFGLLFGWAALAASGRRDPLKAVEEGVRDPLAEAWTRFARRRFGETHVRVSPPRRGRPPAARPTDPAPR